MISYTLALVFLIITVSLSIALINAFVESEPIIRGTKLRRVMPKKQESASSLPTTFDWTQIGFDLPVHNEGQCGGATVGWTTADAIAAANFVANGRKPPVSCSAAQLIDCFDVVDGCDGGYLGSTIQNLMKNSSGILATDASYPYSPLNARGGQGVCTRPDIKNACSSKVIGYEKLPGDEEKLKEILYKEGPIAVVTSPAYAWNYSGGVVMGSSSGCAFSYFEHMLLLVGWGERYVGQKMVKYFKFKNSFGTDWGENGYVNFEAGVNCSGWASGLARRVLVQKN